METYIVVHSDKTLDDKVDLLSEVDKLAEQNQSDIIIKNIMKYILVAVVEASDVGVSLLKKAGFTVTLNETKHAI